MYCRRRVAWCPPEIRNAALSASKARSSATRDCQPVLIAESPGLVELEPVQQLAVRRNLVDDQAEIQLGPSIRSRREGSQFHRRRGRAHPRSCLKWPRPEMTAARLRARVRRTFEPSLARGIEPGTEHVTPSGRVPHSTCDDIFPNDQNWPRQPAVGLAASRGSLPTTREPSSSRPKTTYGCQVSSTPGKKEPAHLNSPTPAMTP